MVDNSCILLRYLKLCGLKYFKASDKGNVEFPNILVYCKPNLQVVVVSNTPQQIQLGFWWIIRFLELRVCIPVLSLLEEGSYGGTCLIFMI